MTVYTYTGRLTDFGRAPFPGAVPKLIVVPVKHGYGASGLLARKQIPVTLASDGSFSVRLEASASVRPEAIYSLRCDWLDTAGSSQGSTEWARFRAPAGGGHIGDVAQEPTPQWAIAYGFGPPPPGGREGLYIDISGPEAVLYGPEGGRI